MPNRGRGLGKMRFRPL